MVSMAARRGTARMVDRLVTFDAVKADLARAKEAF